MMFARNQLKVWHGEVGAGVHELHAATFLTEIECDPRTVDERFGAVDVLVTFAADVRTIDQEAKPRFAHSRRRDRHPHRFHYLRRIAQGDGSILDDRNQLGAADGDPTRCGNSRNADFHRVLATAVRFGREPNKRM